MDVIEELKFLGKLEKEKIGGSAGGRRVGWGGQGGCERRIKVFVKIQKKRGGRGVRWGGRVGGVGGLGWM